MARNFKILTLKEKMQYIFDYYKLHIFVGIIVVILTGNYINITFINPPPTPFLQIAIIDQALEDDLLEQFLATTKNHLIPEELAEDYTIIVHNIPISMELIVIDTTEDGSEIAHLSEQDEARLLRLNSLINTRQLDVFISGHDIFNGFAENGWFLPLNENIDTNHFAGRLLMLNGNIYGIRLDDSQVIKDLGYNVENAYIGIMANSQNIRNSLGFFNFIFE